MKAKIIKIISIFVSISFLTNGVVFAQPQISPQPVVSGQPQASIYIPEQYGKIDKLSQDLSPSARGLLSKSPTVILIKDAHCHYEAQRNIAKILDILIKEYGIDLIGVEGAGGKVDPSIIGNSKDEKKRKQVADKYLKKGWLTASEALAMEKGKDYEFSIFGVENLKLYLNDLKAFRDVYKGNTDAQRFIEKCNDIISNLKTRLYSKAILDYDKKIKDYRANEISLTELIEFLYETDKQDFLKQKNLKLVLKAVRLEKAIDFKKVEKERADLIKECEKRFPKEDIQALVQKSLLYKLGKISSLEYYRYLEQYTRLNRHCEPRRGEAILNKNDEIASLTAFARKDNMRRYIHTLKLHSKIDEDRLFEEIDTLIEDIYSRFLTDELSVKLHRIDEYIYLLNKLLKLEITRDELERYRGSDIKIDEAVNFLSIQAKTNIDVPDEFMKQPEEFYRYAIERDNALIENLIKRMEEQKKDKAVLIIGGFHADGAEKLLKEKGIEVITITPSITKEDTEARKNYLSRIMDEMINPEKMLAGLENISAPVATADVWKGQYRVLLDQIIREISGELKSAVETALGESENEGEFIGRIKEVISTLPEGDMARSILENIINEVFEDRCADVYSEAAKDIKDTELFYKDEATGSRDKEIIKGKVREEDAVKWQWGVISYGYGQEQEFNHEEKYRLYISTTKGTHFEITMLVLKVLKEKEEYRKKALFKFLTSYENKSKGRPEDLVDLFSIPPRVCAHIVVYFDDEDTAKGFYGELASSKEWKELEKKAGEEIERVFSEEERFRTLSTPVGRIASIAQGTAENRSAEAGGGLIGKIIDMDGNLITDGISGQEMPGPSAGKTQLVLLKDGMGLTDQGWRTVMVEIIRVLSKDEGGLYISPILSSIRNTGTLSLLPPGMEQYINNFLPGKEIKIIAENDIHIRGFCDGNTIYIRESLLSNPIALFHELGEGFYRQNPKLLPKGINAHTYLRGVGKDARAAFKGLETEEFATADDLITTLESRMTRKLTDSEKNLIKYNWGKNDKKARSLYGLQDKVFTRSENEELTAKIKTSTSSVGTRIVKEDGETNGPDAGVRESGISGSEASRNGAAVVEPAQVTIKKFTTGSGKEVTLKINGDVNSKIADKIDKIADAVYKTHKIWDRPISNDCAKLSRITGREIDRNFNGEVAVKIIGCDSLYKRREDIAYPENWKSSIIWGNHYLTYFVINDCHIAVDSTAKRYTDKLGQDKADAEVFIAGSPDDLTRKLCAYYGGNEWNIHDEIKEHNFRARYPDKWKRSYRLNLDWEDDEQMAKVYNLMRDIEYNYRGILVEIISLINKGELPTKENMGENWEKWLVLCKLIYFCSVRDKFSLFHAIFYNVFDAYGGKNFFCYENKEGTVMYINGIRCKLSLGLGIQEIYLIKDSRRDWQDELYELSIKLKELRTELLNILFKKYPGLRESYTGNLFLPGGTNDILIELVKNDIRENNHDEDFSDIAGLEKKIELAKKLFACLIEYRNESPNIIHIAAQRRESLIKETLASLEYLNEGRVNIYVSNQRGAGVLGCAKLIADGLISASSKLQVDVFILDGQASPDGISFERKVNNKIKFVSVSKEDLVGGKRHKEARVHIAVGLCLNFVDRNDVTFIVNPMPNAQLHRYDSVEYYSQKANNDINDPFGTVYLDSGLYKRRIQKDSWSQEKLITERREWLNRVLTVQQAEKLQNIGKGNEGNGWDPAKAIWTWGYFQDTAKFLEEVDILCQAFSSRETMSEMPFAEGERQLLFHLVPGKWNRPNFDPIKLAERGITVIDETGKELSTDYPKKVPITVILHSSIHNEEFRTLQSELSGTLARSSNNRFWIDFPCFVTGTASWLEAVSSGSIWLHDDFDTNPQNKRKILISTIIRMLALDDVEGMRQWQDLKNEAEQIADKLLMGGDVNPEKYYGLEAMTLNARRYTEAIFKFNMVDDVLFQVVHVAKEKKPSNDKAHPTTIAGLPTGKAGYENKDSNPEIKEALETGNYACFTCVNDRMEMVKEVGPYKMEDGNDLTEKEKDNLILAIEKLDNADKEILKGLLMIFIPGLSAHYSRSKYNQVYFDRNLLSDPKYTEDLKWQMHHEIQEWQEVRERTARGEDMQNAVQNAHKKLIIDELRKRFDVKIEEDLDTEAAQKARDLFRVLQEDGKLNEEEVDVIRKKAEMAKNVLNRYKENLPQGFAKKLEIAEEIIAMQWAIEALKAEQLPQFISKLVEALVRLGGDEQLVRGLVMDMYEYDDCDEYFALMLDGIRTIFEVQAGTDADKCLNTLENYVYAKSKFEVKEEKFVSDGDEIYNVLLEFRNTKGKGNAKELISAIAGIAAEYMDNRVAFLNRFTDERKRRFVEDGINALINRKRLNDKPGLWKTEGSQIERAKAGLKKFAELLDEKAGLPAEWRDNMPLLVDAKLLSGNMRDSAVWLFKQAASNRQLYILSSTDEVRQWLSKNEINANFIREYSEVKQGTAVAMLAEGEESNAPENYRVITGTKEDADMMLMSRMAGIMGEDTVSKDKMETLFKAYYGVENLNDLTNDEIKQAVDNILKAITQGAAFIIKLPPISPFIEAYYNALKNAKDTTGAAA